MAKSPPALTLPITRSGRHVVGTNPVPGSNSGAENLLEELFLLKIMFDILHAITCGPRFRKLGGGGAG